MIEKDLISRVVWIDYAKAIGIILVVYGHVARGLVNSGIDAPLEVYRLLDSVVYSFHMPLFFFISGLHFLDSLARRGSANLIFSKIDTIFYPYVIWSFIQGGIEVILSKYTNGKVSVNEVFALFWAPRAQFWFLYALFLIFVFSIALYSIDLIRKVWVVTLVSVLMYFAYPLFSPNIFIGFIFGNFVFFSFGMLFSAYLKPGYFESGIRVFLFLSLFLIFHILFHGFLYITYDKSGAVSLFLAIFSIFFVISVSSWIAKGRSDYLRLIGVSSMAIYLMHILVGSGVRIILGKYFGVTSFFIHLVLGVVFAVSIPVIAFLIIRKFDIKFVFSAPISAVLNKIFIRKL